MSLSIPVLIDVALAVAWHLIPTISMISILLITILVTALFLLCLNNPLPVWRLRVKFPSCFVVMSTGPVTDFSLWLLFLHIARTVMSPAVVFYLSNIIRSFRVRGLHFLLARVFFIVRVFLPVPVPRFFVVFVTGSWSFTALGVIALVTWIRPVIFCRVLIIPSFRIKRLIVICASNHLLSFINTFGSFTTISIVVGLFLWIFILVLFFIVIHFVVPWFLVSLDFGVVPIFIAFLVLPRRVTSLFLVISVALVVSWAFTAITVLKRSRLFFYLLPEFVEFLLILVILFLLFGDLISQLFPLTFLFP